jgi:hypothetical protein
MTPTTRSAAAALVAVALLTAAACGPPPATGPRQTGASSRAFVGDAEVEVRYRYEPRPGKLVELYVDLSAKGADGGQVEATVTPHGFDVTRGEASWHGALPAGQTQTHTLTLSAGTEPAPTVTITTRQLERNVELSSDTLRFVVTDDEVRECRVDDEACR